MRSAEKSMFFEGFAGGKRKIGTYVKRRLQGCFRAADNNGSYFDFFLREGRAGGRNQGRCKAFCRDGGIRARAAAGSVHSMSLMTAGIPVS